MENIKQFYVPESESDEIATNFKKLCEQLHIHETTEMGELNDREYSLENRQAFISAAQDEANNLEGAEYRLAQLGVIVIMASFKYHHKEYQDALDDLKDALDWADQDAEAYTAEIGEQLNDMHIKIQALIP